jgi:F0F1-type ATP synthase assembly protein I
MSNDASGGPGKRGPAVPGGDGDAWAVVSYLIAGVGFWGFVGWLMDRWLGTSWLVMIGVLVGFAGAFYLIIRRFGKG